MSELNELKAERVCDQENCRSPLAAFNLSVGLVSDPDRPQTQTLALVLACTRTPPRLSDGKPNPAWRPEDMVTVARWTRGFDICSLDCFLNQMEAFWKLGRRRAERLWATGEQDWR